MRIPKHFCLLKNAHYLTKKNKQTVYYKENNRDFDNFINLKHDKNEIPVIYM